MGSGVTYTFTTSLGDILTRVPIGAWLLDFVKKVDTADNPVIANRFPPPPIPTSLEASGYETYELRPGDQLVVATPVGAQLECANAELYNLQDGDTLKVRIDGGYTQEIILSGLTAGAATAEEIARSIHLQLRKARAGLSSAGAKFTLYSKTLGTSSSVFVSGGTAATVLGFDIDPVTGPVYGSAGQETATFTAVAAQVDSGNSSPFDLDPGDTLLVAVNGGGPQTITFTAAMFSDIDAATAAEVAEAITAQLVEAGAATIEAGAKIRILTDRYGSDASIQITGGTANAPGKLNFPTGLEVGSGAFADLAAATASEVAAFLNGVFTRTLCTIAAEGLRVRLNTEFEELSCSGDAAIILGLAASGQATSGAQPFSIVTGQTLSLKVDGGVEQTVRLELPGGAASATLSAQAVIDLLNFHLIGATALVDDSGTRVTIRSDSTTSSSSVQVTGGSANPVLAFDLGLHTGVGVAELGMAEIRVNEPVELMLFDISSSGFDWAKVWVTGNFERKLVWDSSLPYTDPGWSVNEAQSASPGSGVDDVWAISLRQTVDFVSDELMVVEVQARTLGAETLTDLYYFVVEDKRQPSILKITAWRPNKLRVKFSEPMNQTLDDPTSSLYTRDVSGRIAYYSVINIGGTDYESVVEAPVAGFVEAEVGTFLGSAGARNALNNGCWEILQRLSDTMVQVAGSLVDEDPADPRTETQPSVYVTPYRINRIEPPAGEIQPTFQPVVIDAVPIPSSSLPVGEEVGRFVELTLQDALTPSVDYQLEVVKIEDPAGNEIGSTYTFSSWAPFDVPGREFDLWDMLPSKNQAEDKSRDLERFIKCFNEATQVMLNDVDRFGRLLDPWACKEQAVDPLLGHLGNPFAFVSGLTLDRKRDLIPILVPIYKQRGTAEGIEDAVRFFLSKTVTVRPWDLPTDTWTLGVSLLGYNNYVGPSQSYVRYSFYLEHSEALTENEKSIIKEIVEFIRPAHTHFIGFQLV